MTPKHTRKVTNSLIEWSRSGGLYRPKATPKKEHKVPRKPDMRQAEQAAELLGIDVFYLGEALRDLAVSKLYTAVNRVRDLEPLEVDTESRMLLAAEACDESWAERQRVNAAGSEKESE